MTATTDADHSIKRGDTAPPMLVTLTSRRQPVDLTQAASVELHMEQFNGAKTVTGPMTVLDAASGLIEYEWAPLDTDTVGLYRVEFEVTWTDSTVQTFPNDGYRTVRVVEDLG